MLRDADDNQPLSVTEFNSAVKDYVEATPLLKHISIRGQVSGNRRYPNGNCYFSLVDEQAGVRCVLFRNGIGSERLEDGAQVVIKGSINYYERRGDLSVRVREVQPYGLGTIQKQFEVLKAKLQAEGLFDTQRKRPLKPFPRDIAIVTSAEGAALQDVLNVLKTRYPLTTAIVVPAFVGGEKAAKSVTDGLKRVFELRPDVCLLVRGGGAPEELWPFNDETLARTIFASPVPIVTGIGHETDTTIADLVADLHAPSPSAAAERITPDRAKLLATINERQATITTLVNSRLNSFSEELMLVTDRLSSRDTLQQHQEDIRNNLQRCNSAINANLKLDQKQLDGMSLALNSSTPDTHNRFKHIAQLAERARKSATYIHQIQRNRITALGAQLQSLSPRRVLSRGYSITTLANDTVVKDAIQVKEHDILKVELHRGTLRTVVATANGKQRNHA